MHISPELKVWGKVRHIFGSNACAVSVLSVEKGKFCSRHLHRERVNRFVVVTGCIEVVEYDAAGKGELLRARLVAGDVHDVLVGVVHRFEVIESGVVVEVYWPDDDPAASVRLDDIERLDTGGTF